MYGDFQKTQMFNSVIVSCTGFYIDRTTGVAVRVKVKLSRYWPEQAFGDPNG
jgi:hypothetical protein